MLGNQFFKPFFVAVSFLLFVFLAKELFLVFLIPVFQGTDEPVHYATILAQQAKTKDDISFIEGQVNQDMLPFQFFEVFHQETNTQNFSSRNPLVVPLRESPTIKVSNTKHSWYYSIESYIHSVGHTQNIGNQVILLRLMSVLLGCLIVILSFATARTIGLSQMASILVATLVAFQPMFSFLSAIINIDIALYFSFALFIYGGVLLLRDGLRLIPFIITTLGITLAITSKGPGVALLLPYLFLLGYGISQKISSAQRRFPLLAIGIISFLLFLGIFLVPGLTPGNYIKYITKIGSVSAFTSPIESIQNYLSKSLSDGAIHNTELSYWGNFGWLDTPISSSILSSIACLEILGSIGLILFFFSKKTPPHLPSKIYFIFFLILLSILQIAIRFYDWRTFDSEGHIAIGTPGRYFLPNLIPHLLLVISGLGFFTKNERQFRKFLLVLTLGMIVLSLYSIFFVILPRYYL